MAITASPAALYNGTQNALDGQTITFYSDTAPLGTGVTEANVSNCQSNLVID